MTKEPDRHIMDPDNDWQTYCGLILFVQVTLVVTITNAYNHPGPRCAACWDKLALYELANTELE